MCKRGLLVCLNINSCKVTTAVLQLGVGVSFCAAERSLTRTTNVLPGIYLHKPSGCHCSHVRQRPHLFVKCMCLHVCSYSHVTVFAADDDSVRTNSDAIMCVVFSTGW